MKRTPLVATLLLAATLPALAQINVGGTPSGLHAGLSRSVVPTLHTAPFDAQAVAAEDALREQKGKLRLYGRRLPLEAEIHNSGTWTEQENGDRIWRLRVQTDGALANELYFEDMFLPEGARLYVYDDDGNQLLGGFTSYNNRPSGRFSTAQVMGDACIIEYDEPLAVAGEGSLRLASVGHAYRDVGLAQADACEVDVNCSEGDGWGAQRDAVVRISVIEGAQQGWCSGALVNNQTLDCKPYFLTANHCGEDVTANDLESWKFYFKFQRPGCASGTALAGKVLTGCVERGESNDNGGDQGSDFLLVEAQDATIPESYSPYWCGWDVTGTAIHGGKGIHHPAGDEKKISTFTVTTQSASWWTVPNTHWMLTWAGTTNGHGVTEGGSSGSPLFNSDHNIVGTLTGGTSACVNGGAGPGTGPNGQDFYGKMSYHWQSDPGASTDKLKHWLDPNSTGVLTLDGSYGPCGTLGLHQAALEEAPTVFPDPATDLITVAYPAGIQQVERLEVSDITGRTVLSMRPTTSGKIELDVTAWSSGTYIVRITAGGVRYAGARFQVVRP